MNITSTLRTATPAMLLVVLLAGCATPPRHYEVVRTQPVYVPPPEVYYYPTQQQTADQQSRDRYECNDWAVKQSGYDPATLHPSAQATAAGLPRCGTPVRDVAVGAIGGAALGCGRIEPA